MDEMDDLQAKADGDVRLAGAHHHGVSNRLDLFSIVQ